MHQVFLLWVACIKFSIFSRPGGGEVLKVTQSTKAFPRGCFWMICCCLSADKHPPNRPSFLAFTAQDRHLHGYVTLESSDGKSLNEEKVFTGLSTAIPSLLVSVTQESFLCPCLSSSSVNTLRSRSEKRIDFSY